MLKCVRGVSSALVVGTALMITGCITTSTVCPQVACDTGCSVGRGADGCDVCSCPAAGSSSSSGSVSTSEVASSAAQSSSDGASSADQSSSASAESGSSAVSTTSSAGICVPTATSPDAGQLEPSTADGGVSLVVLRGNANAINPVTDQSSGPAALVNLQAVGLSTNAEETAAVQSFGNGIKLVSLGAAAAVLGTVPAPLDGQVYDFGTAASFGPKAPALFVLPGLMPTGTGVLDVVSVVATDSFTAPSQLYGTALAQRPVGTPPVAGTPVAGNVSSGFVNVNAAVVGSRYLYARNDVDNSVDAFDLLSFTGGTGFLPVPTRSFQPPATECFQLRLAAMTTAANSVSGELAVAFATTDQAGAGIYVFNPETLAFTRALLPPAPDPATQSVDLSLIHI